MDKKKFVPQKDTSNSSPTKPHHIKDFKTKVVNQPNEDLQSDGVVDPFRKDKTAGKTQTLSSQMKEIFKEVEHKHIDYLKELIFEANKAFLRDVLEDIDKIKTATYNWKFLDRVKEIIRERAGAELI